MKQIVYFDYFNQNHIQFLKYLETGLGGTKDRIEIYPFGEKTQHIFKNGEYYMTLDWKII